MSILLGFTVRISKKQKTIVRNELSSKINPDIPKKDIPDGYTKNEYINAKVETYKKSVAQLFGGKPAELMIQTYKRKLEEEYK